MIDEGQTRLLGAAGISGFVHAAALAALVVVARPPTLAPAASGEGIAVEIVSADAAASLPSLSGVSGADAGARAASADPRSTARDDGPSTAEPPAPRVAALDGDAVPEPIEKPVAVAERPTLPETAAPPPRAEKARSRVAVEPKAKSTRTDGRRTTTESRHEARSTEDRPAERKDAARTASAEAAAGRTADSGRASISAHAGGGGGDEFAAYLARVRGRIASRQTTSDGEQGRVTVRFEVGGDGGFTDVSAVSGDRGPLADAAVRVVRRASPAPPIPPSLGRRQITMNVTIAFE